MRAPMLILLINQVTTSWHWPRRTAICRFSDYCSHRGPSQTQVMKETQKHCRLASTQPEFSTSLDRDVLCGCRLSRVMVSAIARETAANKQIQATEFSQIDAVRILLDAGADINATDTFGRTVIFRASHHDQIDLMQVLVKAGVDLSVRDRQGLTVLLTAAIEKKPAVLRFLNKIGDKPETAADTLLFASAVGDLATVREQIANGVSVNGNGGKTPTPLMAAAGNGRASVVRLLLKAGADPNTADMFGITTMFVALRSTDLDTVMSLIDGGADMKACGNGITCLTFAATYFDDPDLLYRFVKAGIGVNDATKTYNYTALMAAATFGHFLDVVVLIRLGAKVNVQHQDGSTALIYAAQSGRPQIVTTLL